jgi:hypothetical protein
VLFFGDIFSAKVATVGLNPSDKEYTDPHGGLLSGSAQRFATLTSLGASDRSSLSDEQCDEAVRCMQAYHDTGNPVYRWFAPLERLLSGLGVSLGGRTAGHLDLVQEATSPTWSMLAKDERDRLLAADLPFLEWQIRTFPLMAVICTGRSASEHVRRVLNVPIEETGVMARIKWWTGHAVLDGRRVGFAGWNIPLQRPTGLGAVGERTLGQLLGERLGL